MTRCGVFAIAGVTLSAVVAIGFTPSASTAERATVAAKPAAVIRGVGARVVALRLPATRPLVVSGTHRGSSNFIVDLVPRNGRSTLLFNEIGRFSGQTAVGDAVAGRYRIRVQADGAWVLRFAQPRPSRRARRIIGTFTGRGSRVVQARAARDLQPVVTARHTGRSNFIVELISYRDPSFPTLVFNEIGRYKGQTLIDELEKGSYLLHIEADGAWRLSFRP